MFTAAVMNVHRDACRVRLWGPFFKIRGEPGGRNKGKVHAKRFSMQRVKGESGASGSKEGLDGCLGCGG